MRKSKKKKISKFFIISLFLILISMIIYNVYIMYRNIEITNNSNYQVSKLQLSTDYLQTVDSVSQNNVTVADMLEKAIENVVGISKLTSAGGSILNNVSSDELGLGTGIIVSSNGYILSNSHVTGEKYSTCYVTVDELQYKGTVVWSDSNLDLSIIKIQANNLKYATLGDSSNLRVGEQVYAIRKSNSDMNLEELLHQV